MAKQLSDILEAAEQVRDEQTPEANTAERVGGVLTDLAQYVGQSLMVSDVKVEADATGVYLKLYFNDDNGEPYERKLKLPNANPNAENPKSGVLSPALFEELKAAGGLLDLGEFDTTNEAEENCTTMEVVSDSKICLIRYKYGGDYYYIHQDVYMDEHWCIQETSWGYEKVCRCINFAGNTIDVGEWQYTEATGLLYNNNNRTLSLKGLLEYNEIGERVQLPLASASVAGLMDPAQFTKLQGIAPVFKNNPTATASQNGLMSAADKQNLDALMTRVAALEAAASAAAE